MQAKQSVEELGVELQKLGRKAFPTSGAKETGSSREDFTKHFFQSSKGN